MNGKHVHSGNRMNSCLYKAKVFHHRLEPKQHKFSYNIFMFCIDLDELDQLPERFSLISRNRFNVFSFRDSEHLQFPAGNPDTSLPVRQQIEGYLRENNIGFEGGKIMLLTNLNVLGYNFNPVSFYFVSNAAGKQVACVVEVQNTFREMKPFLLTDADREGTLYHLQTTKYFYVSPFFDHDIDFDFRINVLGENLAISINDLRENKPVFISTLTGKQKSLTNSRLFWYAFRFPFITLRIIFLIHWHALLLWMKKLPYHKKSAHANLQRGVFRKKE